MSRPIPVSVIGCGHLGTYHARLYAGLPEARLHAVMDIVPEKAKRLGEELQVPWTVSLPEALLGAQAVSVATPTSTHAQVGGAVLAAGCSVLIEKPLAAQLEEGESLVRQAELQGLILAVGHVERWNPAVRAAWSHLGSPRFIESHRLAPFVPRSLDIDVVLDLMIHDLDLTLSLLPGPIESIDAVGVPVLTPGEDIANARLRFADGAVANLTASRVSRERVRKIRFFGARRYVSLDLIAGRAEQVLLEAIPEGEAAVSLPKIDPTSTPGVGEQAALLTYLAERRLRLRHGEIPASATNPLEEELKDFLGAVEGRPLRGATGRDGLRSLRVALEIRRRVQESLARLEPDLKPRRDAETNAAD